MIYAVTKTYRYLVSAPSRAAAAEVSGPVSRDDGSTHDTEVECVGDADPDWWPEGALLYHDGRGDLTLADARKL